MTSSRSQKILNLVIQPKLSSPKPNEEIITSPSIIFEEQEAEICFIENQENICPSNINCGTSSSNKQIHSKSTSILSSLVPNYNDMTSSDDEEIIQIMNPVTATAKANSSSSSSSKSSSSTSSSSSSSFGSSSSSSTKSSSNDERRQQETGYTNTENTLHEVDDDNIIDNANSLHNLRNRNVLNLPNFAISPIYTDESDIDLSDEDPTINFDKLLDKLYRNRNLLMRKSVSSESDSSNSTQDSDRKGRKRSRNVAKWRQNKTKRLRNTGEKYTSLSKTRKIVSGRCLKDTCTEKCRFKCTQQINIADRYHIFTQFWSLGNLSKQRAFILKCMIDVKPKYKYTNSAKPRNPNKAYYFTVNDRRVRVCKLFFKNTLDISERMVFTVQSKINKNGFLVEDLRGKHGNHRKVNPELIMDIKKHIDAIPKLESHYVRATTSKTYIDGGKTIKDLYNDFKEEQLRNNKDFGNYMAYYKIFTTNFNIGFHQPKKDQCDLCVSYANSNSEQKTEIEHKYQKHLEEKILSRQEKHTDRKNVTKDNKVVIYDLEAVLQCPRGDTSAFYYRSKFNSYNFTLTELTRDSEKKAYDNVFCYFWTEVEAKRGAVEIGSCILKYLKNVCEEDSDEKHVTFYSDNCCGQNKNKYIVTLYMYAVNLLNVASITYKYLITGHTQNEADSVHSLIEKEVKKNLKSGPIYTPDQYVTLIKNAKKTKPYINVHELTYEQFEDIKTLQEEWGYNYSVDTDGNNIIWNDIKLIKVEKARPFSFFLKTSYQDSSFREVDVRNKRKKMNPISTITLNKAYTERQQLSVNKKKDLKDLITKGLIPSFYASFYSSVV